MPSEYLANYLPHLTWLLPNLPINNMTGIVDSMGNWVQNSWLDISPFPGLMGVQFQMAQSTASYNKQG